MKHWTLLIWGALFICAGVLGIQGKLFAQQQGGWQYGVSPKIAFIGWVVFLTLGIIVCFMGVFKWLT